jgi:ferredoxin--NADP+ reductase
MTGQQLTVAVVGAGPAGIYAASLLRARAGTAAESVAVDVFEALPAPYGLIRYGVAPDHPRIKGIVVSLQEMLNDERTRFIGNVTVGRDVTIDELRRHYHAVVVATGADRDALMTLPGTDLPGCFGAADFVAWYDGHPDHPRRWSLDAREVAVVGNGNVALDVARVLIKTAPQLLPTDMPDTVLREFERSAVTDVHVFGRRGPGQTKFTPIELRELGEIDGVDIVLDDADFALAEHDPEWVEPATNQQKIMKRILQGWRSRPVGDAPRRVHLHFWCEPVRVTGGARVDGIEFRRRMLGGADGATTVVHEVTHPVQAVYRAVGYRGSPVPGVPFDEARGVVPNVEGRVTDDAGRPVGQLYVTGWAKRGPIGLIGHTKSDAMQTVDSLVGDLDRLPAPAAGASDSLIESIRSRGVDIVQWDDWHRLDAHEIALGANHPGLVRERVKVIDRDEQVRFARGDAFVGAGGIGSIDG